MNTFATLESLETRNLCSATPVASPPVETQATPAIHSMALPQRRHLTSNPNGVGVVVPAAPVAPASRLGTFVGSVTVTTPRPMGSLQFTLTITHIKKGKLTGLAKLPFTGSLPVSISGKLDASGKFSTSYQKGGITGTVSGKIDASGLATGKFTISPGFQKFSGTFSAQKI